MSLQKIPLSWGCRGDDIYTACSRYSFLPNEKEISHGRVLGQTNTLEFFRNGAVGFIDWLDLCRFCCSLAYSCFVRATWLSSEEQECCGCCGEDRVVQWRLGAQCHCHRSCE